jgi:hypothetical protein
MIIDRLGCGEADSSERWCDGQRAKRIKGAALMSAGRHRA